MRASIAIVLAVALPQEAWASGPCASDPDRSSKQVAPGITLIEESCTDPLYHAFLVEVDLSTPGVGFLVTPFQERLGTTSGFATAHGAIVAINGGFWDDTWGGYTVSSAKRWPKRSEDLPTSTVVGFGGREDGRLRVEIRPTGETLASPPAWMAHAVTANPLLLDGGKIVASQVEHTLFLHKHPRTAIGLSEDGSRMILAVIDGRRPDWSLGMRTAQVAALLASHGAWRAANLDGGASSTLVIPTLGGLVNRPCYKKAAERIVPNQIGIVPVEEPSALARLLAPLARLLPIFA